MQYVAAYSYVYTMLDSAARNWFKKIGSVQLLTFIEAAFIKHPVVKYQYSINSFVLRYN